MRDIREGPRNFEPWSCDEDDTRVAPHTPNFLTTSTGGHLSHKCLTSSGLLCTAALQRCKARTHDTPAMCS
ncbi:hypothetical protein TNCV_4172961 [Trichonephila clavipes]|nr:hypothetical protein TNCV_4172961 [Trichonephila clavipes]